MKILHINSYYSVSKFYKNLYDQQLRNELDIDVYVPVTSSYQNINNDFGPYTTLSTSHSSFDRSFYHLKQFKIYNDIIKKYDISKYSIIHAHSLFSNGYLAMKLKEQYGIPYIVAVRNTDVNIFFKRMIHLRKVGIRILENAEQIIFLSKSYRDEVIEKYISEDRKERILEKTEVIPNGIDDFWLKNIGKIKSTPKKNEVQLLFVGVVNKNKNITAITKAMEFLSEQGVKSKLTVVGRIESKKSYDEITKFDSVKYIEPTSKEKLLEIYRENDIFVMPSIHESFGLVYAEALSQGLPVIYSRGQGFDGQFEDGEVGYSVDSNSPREIAEVILKVTNDLRLISINSLRNVQIFNWNTINQTYIGIYNDIVSSE